MDQVSITCQICSRSATTLLPFFCPQCAQSRLYSLRVQHAQTLIDKELIGHEVRGFLGGKRAGQDDGGDEKQDRAESSRAISRDSNEAHLQECRAATAVTSQACEEVAEEVKRLRIEAAERRRLLEQREGALTKKKEVVSARGLRNYDPLPGVIRKIETDWIRLYGAISEDRMLLCTEVASLYGLDLKRRTRESRNKDVYYLGDVPIIDLRELNGAVPTIVTVSLGRVAHLLHLTSHYLSLQLPAEITLPSSTNPHTVIHTPHTSYKDPTLPAGQRLAASINATKLSRQRLLYLDKPLPTLAAEDQIAYSLFIDAVALLAWDIAWLAKSQGIEIGVKHWDEVCPMGRNLWQLFGPQARLPNKALSPTRAAAHDAAALTQNINQAPTSTGMARTSSGGSGPATTKRPAHLQAAAAAPITPGRLSHDSAFAFQPAAAAQGGSAEIFRAWSLANPIRLIERIKAALANERTGAEWEVLEKEAWEGHDAAAEDASGATTPLAAALEGGATGAARMRELLLGRTLSSGGGGSGDGEAGGGTASGDEAKAYAQTQQRRWLRVRSQDKNSSG